MEAIGSDRLVATDSIDHARVPGSWFDPEPADDQFRRNPVAPMDRGEVPLTRRLQSSIVIIANCRCARARQAALTASSMEARLTASSPRIS